MPRRKLGVQPLDLITERHVGAGTPAEQRLDGYEQQNVGFNIRTPRERWLRIELERNALRRGRVRG